jgi:hypothetical protein
MASLEHIEHEIEQIKVRNKKVEADKAWETSWTRKVIVAILTYLVIVLFFYFAHLPEPFANAVVPTVAFLISTSSIPLFKKFWIKYIHKN